MLDECIVDLHIHSKFSRACSKNLVLPKIAEVAALKGINVIGTGDFTHPEWFKMMHNELEQSAGGFYKVKNCQIYREVNFVPTAEIACIYSKGGKVRRLHIIIVAPTLEVVEKINNRLAEIGNLKADGRPILGLDAKILLKIVLDISPDCLVIPAHAWTPWFSVFGSKSGFDSLEECFEELTKYIPAIETGLSSDPPMNWRLSALDKVSLVSNSDAHSLDNLGREANVFKTGSGLSYSRLVNIIRQKEKNSFLYTIEFHPEEGKYHVDGHAPCGVRLMPNQTVKYGGRCPKCQKLITVGVLSRVNDLADKKVPSSRVPYKYIVPLREIISEVVGVGKKSKAVDKVYRALIPSLGTEFELLIYTPISAIEDHGFKDLAVAIDKMRRGDMVILPGYDGVFGTVKIFKENETRKTKQESLFVE